MIDWDSCVLWLDSKYFSESYWWDRSQYKNNGVVYGAKFKEDGFYFDGINDYVKIPNNLLPNPNSFTILAWIYPMGENNTEVYDEQLIVDLRGQYQTSLLWREEDDSDHPATLRFNIYDGSNSYNLYSPNNSIDINKWHFVGGIWDGTNQRIYYDGNVDSQNANNPVSTSYQSKIGKDYQSTDRLWFYGKMSMVMIFKKGLKKEEIDIIYNLTYRG